MADAASGGEVPWLALVAFDGCEEVTRASSFFTAFFDLLVFFEPGGCFVALALRLANGVLRDLGDCVFF